MSQIRTRSSRPATLPLNVLTDEEVKNDLDIQVDGEDIVIRLPGAASRATLNRSKGPQVRFATVNKKIEINGAPRYVGNELGRVIDTPFGVASLILNLDLSGWLDDADYQAAIAAATPNISRTPVPADESRTS